MISYMNEHVWLWTSGVTYHNTKTIDEARNDIFYNVREYARDMEEWEQFTLTRTKDWLLIDMWDDSLKVTFIDKETDND